MLEGLNPKLSRCVYGAWVPHSPKPVFAIEPAYTGNLRVVATAPGSDTVILESLVGCLAPPLMLMFLLHVPITGFRAGRYQSDELSGDEVRAFLHRFSDFLRCDGRCDLWVYSDEDDATIVWDRHNLVYAYGNLPAFSATLRALGFEAGEVKVPIPHQHHYYHAFDNDAWALLGWLHWTYSCLRTEDRE